MSTMLRKANRAIAVRAFKESDVPQILPLMRQLAAYERYLDDFHVTQNDLVRRGLNSDPQFSLFVATTRDTPDQLLGIAVYYFVPYTYDLKPDLILKELYVAEDARGLGVGRALMNRIVSAARYANSRRIRWLVMKDNYRAKQFYSAIGAHPDTKWENWQLKLPPTDAMQL